MTVNDDTIEDGRSGHLTKNIRKDSAVQDLKNNKNECRKPTGALEIRAKNGSAVVSRYSKAALSAFADVLSFHITCTGLNLLKNSHLNY